MQKARKKKKGNDNLVMGNPATQSQISIIVVRPAPSSWTPEAALGKTKK